MALGSRAARVFLFALGAALTLLAPFFAPGGGYGHVAGFKAALWLILAGSFLAVSLFDLPKEKGFFLSPERVTSISKEAIRTLSRPFSASADTVQTQFSLVTMPEPSFSS